MLPIKNRSAWIVQWRKDRRELTKLDLRPHILPWCWSAEKVSDYMQCVYWNSALTTPYGTLLKINIKNPLEITRTNKGSRLSYGDLTRLVAWRVKDLSFERVGSNMQSVKG